MKVLFLDFDGVLNSWAFFSASPGPYARLDPAAVARLSAIVEQTGAKVVISSTWRLGRSIEELRSLLAELGFRGEIIGTTPCLPAGDPSFIDPDMARCKEIRAWLTACADPIERYAILDDAALHDLGRSFVQTRFETGLADEHVEAVVAWLADRD